MNDLVDHLKDARANVDAAGRSLQMVGGRRIATDSVIALAQVQALVDIAESLRKIAGRP